MASPAAASGLAVPFWRSAGMTYITYSNICARLVRNCLKEPHRSEAIAREKVHFTVSKWGEGKPNKPSVIYCVFDLGSKFVVSSAGQSKFLRISLVDKVLSALRSDGAEA